MRLKELINVAPGDIDIIAVVGRTKKTNRFFHNINEMTPQFLCDVVLEFDILNHNGERVLGVILANYGKGLERI